MEKVNQVNARAWCRADFAGGTLDIWPLGLLHDKACTVNVALDLAVEVGIAGRASGFHIVQNGTTVEVATVEEVASNPETALVGLIARYFQLPPVEITVHSGSPRGGGLGASSALTVAMIAAAESYLGLEESDAEARAAVARDLEAQLMGLPTGRQDHFPAQLGGALKIEMLPGGQRITRIETDLDALAQSLIVVYTGQSHFSAGSNWQVIRRRLDGDRDTVRRFEGIAEIAHLSAEALARNDLEELGSLMSREWSYRRGLAKEVSTRRIEGILAAAASAGAWGGKVCGAGGGGCLAVLAPAGARAEVERALVEHQADLLGASPMSLPLVLERS